MTTNLDPGLPIPDDDSLPDLEDLLNPKDCGAIDPLEALLMEAVAETKEASMAKMARERMKRGGQSAKEKAEDEERLRKWELQHEWEVISTVAVFERFDCQCGSHRTVFSQLMAKQRHRHLRDSFRYQTTKLVKADLPNEVAMRLHHTPMCLECCSNSGFLFENPTIWER